MHAYARSWTGCSLITLEYVYTITAAQLKRTIDVRLGAFDKDRSAGS
jgi:hypothetical protein